MLLLASHPIPPANDVLVAYLLLLLLLLLLHHASFLCVREQLAS
jgi:hypothetical protein